jgi:hypothetical protein
MSCHALLRITGTGRALLSIYNNTRDLHHQALRPVRASGDLLHGERPRNSCHRTLQILQGNGSAAGHNSLISGRKKTGLAIAGG